MDFFIVYAPWLLLFISLGFWSLLFLQFKAVWPEKAPEFLSRLITLLHGSLATLVGLWLCGYPSTERCTMKIGSMHYFLMIWSWGYFAFDLIWCLIYWPHNRLMLLHHSCSLVGISLYMTKPYTGCTFPCGLAFLEITNPLLQLRWFLRQSGRDKTIFYTLLEVAYLILFIGLRGFLGTYLIWKIMYSDLFKSDEKLICLILYFVSIGFIYEIIGYVLYKYKTKIEEFEGFLVEVGIILNDQT